MFSLQRQDASLGLVAWFNFFGTLFLLATLAQVWLPSPWVTHTSNTECETPSGTWLGDADGVPAYSNCNCHHISEEYVGVDLSQATFRLVDWNPANENAASSKALQYTGMKWQCVEYARRYWVTKLSVTFGDVVGAEDIWSLSPESFQRIDVRGGHVAKAAAARPVSRESTVERRCVPSSERPPTPSKGSLVIWPRQMGMPFGHVAVVTSVSELRVASSHVPRQYVVRIAEQNFHSWRWNQTGFSRTLQWSSDYSGAKENCSGTLWSLVDPAGYALLGWLTPNQ